MNEDPPGLLETLVLRHLDSMEQAEILLLLRAEPERAWTAEETASRLRIDPQSAARRLRSLAEGGLIAREADASGAGGAAAYYYAPESDDLRRAVDALAVAYNERPVSLVKLLYSRPTDATARSFADAFRIRRNTED